jgi:hypothetical protein
MTSAHTSPVLDRIGGEHAENRIDAAAHRLYDAEIALHIARQSQIDNWIAAAYDQLHVAIREHTVALSAKGPSA